MRSKLRNTAWTAAVVMALGAGMALGQTTFSDAGSDPRSEDIHYAAAQGWFQGYPDGSFRPDQEISETQLAQVIRRARPGMTRGDAAVFIRGGMDRLQASGIPTAGATATTVAVTATATTTTTLSGGEPGRTGAPEDGGGQTGGPGDGQTEGPGEPGGTGAPGGGGQTGQPGEPGPVITNPPVVIEPTTTTTTAAAPADPAPTTTTTIAESTTWYYNSRPISSAVVDGLAAQRARVRYGFENGWTDYSSGQTGSLFWMEAYIKDYDHELPDDRALASWGQNAASFISFTLSGQCPEIPSPNCRPSSARFGTGRTGVEFIEHDRNNLPPAGHAQSMPRLYIYFVPFNIDTATAWSSNIWTAVPERGSARRTWVFEKSAAIPDRAKQGAWDHRYATPADRETNRGTLVYGQESGWSSSSNPYSGQGTVVWWEFQNWDSDWPQEARLELDERSSLSGWVSIDEDNTDSYSIFWGNGSLIFAGAACEFPVTCTTKESTDMPAGIRKRLKANGYIEPGS